MNKVRIRFKCVFGVEGKHADHQATKARGLTSLRKITFYLDDATKIWPLKGTCRLLNWNRVMRDRANERLSD